MIRKILFAFFIFSFTSVHHAQMKRRNYGTYSGEIGKYSVGKHPDQIYVQPTNIEIQILKDQIFVFVGNQKYEGTWNVLLETKVYYLVEAKTNGNAPERLMVYKRERKILREGISPQPNAMLKKVRL